MKDSTEFPLSLNIRASFYLEYSRFYFLPQSWIFFFFFVNDTGLVLELETYTEM